MISTVEPLGHNISRVRIDNNTVLLCKDFTLVCESEGIGVGRTIHYSPWQLGMIERQWRTLVDGAKIILLIAELPERLWGHAFLAMVCIKCSC
jgi:hypothetical protein